MWKTVVCEKCNSIIKYEDKSTFEGNRDFEDIECIVCHNVVARTFTNLIPDVRLVKRGEIVK